MSNPPKIRTIVEQERVSDQLMGFGVASLRVDDVLGGLTETICVRPEVFAQEPHTQWSRIIVKAFPPDIPFLRIWFTYDAETVYIEYIEPLDDLGTK
jgi:hypothetical protein